MNTRTSTFILFLALSMASINISDAQLVIQSGPEITPEDMVQQLIGPGVLYDNVTYQGAQIARGIFSNGDSTNIGLATGIFLTSGAGYIIPGPNDQSSAGVSNGNPGHPLLNALTTTTTFDASVLEFDFVPLNDTVKCRFVFGSEEYSEYVGSSFNDVFGFFITGPKPDSGLYSNFNIALVPDTNMAITINNVNNGFAAPGVVPSGPCMNCEYFMDNTFGQTIQYDGFTTVITLWALVIPDETYHFDIGVADAGDHIFDSGVLIEGTSFKSPGPPEFQSFNFLKENNPALPWDILGNISGNEVFLEVPEGTDVTNLIAGFEARGVEVFLNGELQESGVTANDFTDPLTYHLEGYADQDWMVHVDIVTGIADNPFRNIVIGPNPSNGNIRIENTANIEISVNNLLGKEIFYHKADPGIQSLNLNNLIEGIYFITMEKDGAKETRKVVVY